MEVEQSSSTFISSGLVQLQSSEILLAIGMLGLIDLFLFLFLILSKLRETGCITFSDLKMNTFLRKYLTIIVSFLDNYFSLPHSNKRLSIFFHSQKILSSGFLLNNKCVQEV